MSRAERYVNLTAVFLPPLATAMAIPLLWGQLLNWSTAAVAVALYLVTGFGITLGYHRLLTHRAFATRPGIERVLALAGALAVQGSPVDWVADHRKHHAHTDQDGDPHSPHAGGSSGMRGALRGLWHAHIGWLWRTQGAAAAEHYAPELLEDPFMRRLHDHYHLVLLITFMLRAALGLLISGTWHGALIGLLWGGAVRVMALHHVTWSINSVCHFAGRRRFVTDDHSTNVAWLALASFGEAWHHNHHAFARSAFHGLNRLEAALDPSGWILRLLRRAGLAWNVIEISPERQAERLA